MSTILKICLVLGCLLLVLAFPKVYFVSDASGGELWWKGEEAYLFLGAGHRGNYVSYLGYPWVMLKEYLYAPPLPKNRQFAALVIWITPEQIEKRVVDFGEAPGATPQFLTPFGQDFFAMCPGLILCKLSSQGFVPATEDENLKIGGIEGLARGSIGDEEVNGWRHRSLIPGPGNQFTVDIGKNFSLLVRNHTLEKGANPFISIELLRPGHSAENIYSVDGTPHQVTKQQYEHAFARR